LSERRAAAEAGSTRQLLLGRCVIDYRLIRYRCRSISMRIDGRGLVVRAPRWVTLRDIESALSERAKWIVDTLAQWESPDRASLPAEWRTGATLLYQGRTLSLALFPGRRSSIAADLLNLVVVHPAPADAVQVGSYIARWLKEQALEQLTARAMHFARRLNVALPSVKLSEARTQWGSCTRRGSIRLSWRLVQLPARLADYVVAHEVAHLAELNHSRHFWALVETLLPGHANARRELDAMTPLLG
jgi:predicted metal-dependent hydrolase